MKKNGTSCSFFPPRNDFFSRCAPEGKVTRSDIAQISAWWVCYQKIPFANIMFPPVHSDDLPPLYGLERITENMPLWMAAAWLLYITAVSLMA